MAVCNDTTRLSRRCRGRLGRSRDSGTVLAATVSLVVMLRPQVLHDTGLSIPPGLLESRKHVRWLVGLGTLLVVALVTYAIAMRARNSGGPEYRTMPVERRTVVQTVDATGTLDVAVRLDVPAPIAARLDSIEVAPGAPVHRGQILARLAEGAVTIEVRGAVAERSAAGSRVEEARTALDAISERRRKVEGLAAHGLASQRDVEAARSEEARAKAAARAAAAEANVASEKVRASREQQRLLTIVAPIDGVVIVSPDHPGTVVSPEQQPLFVLGSSLDTMRLDAEVAEADIGPLKPGQDAEFTVPAFSGRTFGAKVERLELQGRKEGASVLYPMTLTVPNPDHVLLPGMTATIKVKVARVENAVAVREVALRFTPEDAPPASPRSRLWQKVDSKLVAVPVVSGISDGVFTEILLPQHSALHPGDDVVVGLAYRATETSNTAPGITLGSRQ